MEIDARYLILGALLTIGLAAIGLRALFTRTREWWILRRRFKRAERLEKEAAWVLRRAGYRIVDAQVKRAWAVYLDGTRVPLEICADYVVAKGLKRYVAEVKTGRVAPKVTHAPTRRQLIEYQLAYNVDGILLVDMEKEAIHHFDAPLPSRRGWRWFVAGGLSAAGLWYLSQEPRVIAWIEAGWVAVLEWVKR